MKNKQKTSETTAFEVKLECIACNKRNCEACRHAIREANKIYCSKMRNFTNLVEDCPYFDLEPLEYKLFVRA